jgi:FkbM family methyltransferase
MKSFVRKLGDAVVGEKFHKFARKLGFEIVPYEPASHPFARRKKLLDTYGITVVLDVGANTGGFGRHLRNIGYDGKIVSFEPLTGAYARLEARARQDGNWETYRLAFGENNGTAMINVAANFESSSLLQILPSHLDAMPDAKYIRQEQVEVKTLDSMFPSICSQREGIYLKIDTQGYEESVLKGASSSLRHIDTIQLEMSLLPLYQGELLFPDLHRRVCELGYSMVSIESGFVEKSTGRLLQIDGIYHRV